MKRALLMLCLAINGYADTIDHYMNIANNIPQMEMKADPQSQAWARSARIVLTLTCDGIADSLKLANDTASQQGHALFCISAGAQVTPEILNDLIQQTYRSLPNSQTEKDKMTVSQIALLAMQKQYPCPGGGLPTKEINQSAVWGAPH
jgi:hypothetical protein